MRRDEEGFLDYRRKLVRESQRKRREKAVQAGLCIICCKRETDGLRTCPECRKRITDARRRKER